jgi:cytochrome P450
MNAYDLGNINFFDPALLAHPFDLYRQLLGEAPVLALPGTDVHLVSSYSLVAEACGRPADFSNDIRVLLAGGHAEHPEVKAILDEGWPQQNVLLMSDPPAHSRYRKLVSLAFSLKRVDRIETEIRRVASGLIDKLAKSDNGDFVADFVADFAIPLPVTIIAGQLGLPEADLQRVKRWTNAFTDRLGGMISLEREIECAREVVSFQQAMKAQIDLRRASPQNDLLNDIVHADVEGEEPLSLPELLSILQQLLVAGNETTTNSLSEGLLMLISQPEAMARLRADPALIPNAVEEILRLASPVQGNWRIVTRDCTLGGVDLKAGSKLMLRMAAADRDPARYEHPGTLDPERRNARTHLAFGRGIHQCIGNLLARRELAVALELLLEGLDDITLDCNPSELVYAPNVMLRGLDRLPIRFRSKK